MHDPADANAEFCERLTDILLACISRPLTIDEAKDLCCALCLTPPTTTKESRHEPA